MKIVYKLFVFESLYGDHQFTVSTQVKWWPKLSCNTPSPPPLPFISSDAAPQFHQKFALSYHEFLIMHKCLFYHLEMRFNSCCLYLFSKSAQFNFRLFVSLDLLNAVLDNSNFHHSVIGPKTRVSLSTNKM